ncbi:MAG: recombinase family protein, partial [Solirubrobacterales bacterium]
MRAAAYLKTYPIDQEPPDMSPVDQRRRVEEHIAARGWELAAVIDDTGTEVERREHPGLERLMHDPPEIDKLVIASLDRIGRRPRLIR